MCGRFTSSQRRETIGERFQVAVPEGYQERFNLAPPEGADRPREGESARGGDARWGLLPHWAKDERISYKLINARSETLLEKPAFRSLVGKYRCLVVADGFYERTVGPDGKKQPIHFRLEDGGVFGFAGLWTCKTDDSSELIESCTIVTTSPQRHRAVSQGSGIPACKKEGRCSRGGTCSSTLRLRLVP
jgi:putative SOS response-associated peptidase YedK